MIRDFDSSEHVLPAAYDLCVIGSGPAGMTIVNELRASGLRIGVLESGRERPTPHGDRLRRVESEGIHVKDYSRERVLGGASTTWAGLSSPFDAVDLGPRDDLDRPAWPITVDELYRFYGEAAERYRFPALASFGAGGFIDLRAKGGLQPAWRELEEKVFLAAAEPQDFGREWRDAFDVEGIDLWLDATVLELEREPGEQRIAAARTRSRSGREERVRARAFVVATGGIENARLLLASRDLCAAGLGNEHDLVGRYLMNHPKNYRGFLRLAAPVTEAPYYFGCLFRGFAGYAGLRLRTDLQLERGLVNSYIRLEPMFPWTDSTGVEALVLFVKRSGRLFAFWKKRHADELVELRDYSETGDDSALQNARKSFGDWLGLLGQILTDLPRVSKYLYYRLSRAKPRIRRARIRNFMEMEPHRDNRVVLSTERGEYGEPLARCVHRCTERDRRSMVAVHDVLARELAENGVGTLEEALVEEEPWPIDQDASHHMGTTRMADAPEEGVVDADLRLHGVHNVYLAGGSVFPSSGCANPTFTLVALSIRLAAHLRGVLAR